MKRRSQNGLPRPDLSHLDQAFIERMQQARNPHLAIEALRRLIEQEMRKVTRHNIVRQHSFSDRLVQLMARYTNQHLTAAQVIAELVAMAREVPPTRVAGHASICLHVGSGGRRVSVGGDRVSRRE